MTQDQQNRLELYREFPNLQQATEAYQFIFGSQDTITDPNPDKRDGVYYIYADGEKQFYQGQKPLRYKSVKYIGVKCGGHSVAVALHDVPGGDLHNEFQLVPDTDKCPKTSEHYSWDRDTDKYRFNAHEDFDGKGNTERLKSYGCEIPLNEGEWIPSVGECTIISMYMTKVNEALEKAGGQRLSNKGHWASTENYQLGAWNVNFGSGSFGTYNKCSTFVVRAVAAF